MPPMGPARTRYTAAGTGSTASEDPTKLSQCISDTGLLSVNYDISI